MAADIPRSTLIDWPGQAAGALRPLVDLIRDVVVASDRIHAADTPIPVLDPRKSSSSASRGASRRAAPGYVKDDRPWAGTDAAEYVGEIGLGIEAWQLRGLDDCHGIGEYLATGV